MDGVDVFDVNSLYNGSPAGRWSKQATTGDSPSPRVEFCIVTVSAQDRSSYNMYTYSITSQGRWLKSMQVHVWRPWKLQ